MHGEFKVPGGKLVVVDLEVVDGRIADFRLAGDFFLEPDEALAGDRRRRQRTARRTPTPRSTPPPSQAALPAGRGRCSASRPSRSPPRSGARCSRRPAGTTTTGSCCIPARLSPQHAPRARPGARRGGRRRPPQADPAHLGVERAGRRDRQLPVGEERGRPRERRQVRLRGRAPHQRRRRDVHGCRRRGHLLALRARSSSCRA